MPTDTFPATPRIVMFSITKSNWGGAQRYVYDLATNLPPHLHAVVVVGGEGELVTRLRARGVETYTLSRMHRDVRMSDEVRTFLDLLRLIRHIHPDVMHLNSSKAGLGALAGRLVGVRRIIFTAHGWAFNEERPRWHKALLRCVYWFTMMLAHHTIAVSEAVRSQVVRWPGIAPRISVVRLGITPPLFLSRTDARNALIVRCPRLRNVSPYTHWIGTIGELHPIKGHRYVLEAFAQNPAIQDSCVFVLLGDGELRDTLNTYIQAHNLERCVTLCGHVSDAALFMRAFDVFVLPSLSEAGAYVIHEAGAAGIPVIASKVGGIPEIVEHNISGILLPPKDSKVIAKALSIITTDLEKGDALGVALQERVLRERTLPEMIENTMCFYAPSNPSTNRPRSS